ncbi:hypothetical protein BHE74_00058584 [Ensete ventricosum]|nr:hypothetical protein BHE74_00058584 [Ensete ventricosum]RZS28761.1 hypothetical protein BHM03_00062413 [Ensete ventricosum]
MAHDELFAETRIPEQKAVGGVLFPAVLSPSPTADLDLGSFAAAVASQSPRLESLLRSSGALLLRGFPVQDAADFDRVVAAFGYDELPYVGGAAPRTNVVGRVFTANESPPDQKIPFHHEMAQRRGNSDRAKPSGLREDEGEISGVRGAIGGIGLDLHEGFGGGRRSFVANRPWMAIDVLDQR